MATTLHLPRRMILASGFAVAMAIAPVVGVLAGTSSPGVSVTADPNNQNCTITQTNGSNALVCPPNTIAANPLLPSEQSLTGQNELRR